MGCHPTAVDRLELVLVIIDLQVRLAAAMEDPGAVVAAARLLIGAAGILGAPVIVTRQYPQGLGDTVPELRAALDAYVVGGGHLSYADKTAFCCASEPEFATALAATKRHHVLVAGMETHVCVAQTALALAHTGHLVHVAADACCSRHVYDHEIALARMRASGVIVTTAEAAVYEAFGEAGTPEFKALLALVR